jgi:FixJ family two-component response regulator
MFRRPNRVVAVVDDDAAFLDSLQDLLESKGYSVNAFFSAEEFLASDSLSLVGCLVSDIQLPGMNGWSLAEFVLSRRAQLPIIFVTAYDGIGRPSESVTLNNLPKAVFRKPFDGHDLLEAVASVFVETQNS